MSTQTTLSADTQIALVVGGTQGIGLALVKSLLEGQHAKFLSKDCKVIATARDPKSAQLLNLQKDYPDRLFIEILDVTDEDSIEKFVTNMNANYPRLDLYIHNAGVVLDDKLGKAYTKIDKKLYFETHMINTIAPQHIFFGLTPLLNKTHVMNGGKVGQKPKPLADFPEKDNSTHVRCVFMSSIMSSIELHNFYYTPIYRTSKTALNFFCRDMALRFPHFSISIMHPGYVATNMTKVEHKDKDTNEKKSVQNGDTTPEESAQGILTVLSNEAYSIVSSKKLLSYDGEHLPF